MVKPGGTGRPREDISARFAPLPPRRFFIDASPSADPPPKPYTHLVILQSLSRGQSSQDRVPLTVALTSVLQARRRGRGCNNPCEDVSGCRFSTFCAAPSVSSAPPPIHLPIAARQGGKTRALSSPRVGRGTAKRWRGDATVGR